MKSFDDPVFQEAWAELVSARHKVRSAREKLTRLESLALIATETAESANEKMAAKMVKGVAKMMAIKVDEAKLEETNAQEKFLALNQSEGERS